MNNARMGLRPFTFMITLALGLLLLAGSGYASDTGNSEDTSSEESRILIVEQYEIKDQRSFLERAYDYVSSFFAPAPMEIVKAPSQEQQKSLSEFIEGSDQPQVEKNMEQPGGQFAWEKSFSAAKFAKITSTETDISAPTYCDIVNVSPPNFCVFATVDSKVTFKWDVTTLLPGSDCSNVEFDIVMDAVNPPVNVVASGLPASTTEFTTDVLANNAEHFWFIRIRNTQTGVVDETNVFVFRPLERPQITVGGYLDSEVSESAGGTLNFMVITTDPNVERMELYFGGQPTGVDMTDFGGGTYQFSLTLGRNDLVAGAPITLEARAFGYGGNAASSIYPALFTDCPGDPCPPAPAPAPGSVEALGETLEKKVQSIENNNNFVRLIQSHLTKNASTAERGASARSATGPVVQLAGYWDTIATASGAGSGQIRMVAYAPSPANGNTISSVEVLFEGAPLGIQLTQNYLDSPDLWEWNFDFGDGGLASLCNTPVVLELQATDSAGNKSPIWPYFTAVP